MRRVLRAKLGFVGFALLLAGVLGAILASSIAAYAPNQITLAARLLPPMTQEDTAPRHWLGTDHLGRDVFSRILYGARVSLYVATVSVVLAGVLGFGLGVAASYAGGILDALVMRAADLQLAFPFLLLALAIIAVLGPSINNIVLVFVVTSWPLYARIARASVLVVRSREYVESARALGATEARILLRHVLPNITSPLLVVASFEMARVIIVEAALGFLGLGVPPPTATWGNMLADGRVYLLDAWWLSTFPGLAIMLLAAGANFLGDAVRDALDPRLR